MLGYRRVHQAGLGVVIPAVRLDAAESLAELIEGIVEIRQRLHQPIGMRAVLVNDWDDRIHV